MDYRKIFIYLVIILAALGYWYKTNRNSQNKADAAEKFASVYAATSVMAELYRNELGRFIKARDSIFSEYNFNLDSIAAFKESFGDREEDWNPIWNTVKIKTDSLIEYFKNNPVEHDLDPAMVNEDSTSSVLK